MTVAGGWQSHAAQQVPGQIPYSVRVPVRTMHSIDIWCDQTFINININVGSISALLLLQRLLRTAHTASRNDRIM